MNLTPTAMVSTSYRCFGRQFLTTARQSAGKRAWVAAMAIVLANWPRSFCLGAPAPGTESPDQSLFRVDRLSVEREEYKTADWGPAHWLKDKSGYATLEASPAFKNAKDPKDIKDIVKCAVETGDRAVAVSAEFDQRATALRKAIEFYFGVEIEGFKTYRYYKGNTTLRSWILLPLAMGITERQEATVAARVSDRLWPKRAEGANILAEMLDADGKPQVCERVWISSVGCEKAEQTGKLTAGFSATTEKIGLEFTFGPGERKFTDARPFWGDASVSPSDFGYHWNRSGETHYLMGERMAQGMTSMLPSP